MVDLGQALLQHAAYVEALEGAGLEVEFVDSNEEFPDCVFIEDTAVVWNDWALVTRMQPDREGEQEAVCRALQRTHKTITLPEGALLEGGDVLHLPDATFVGISSRTNEEGVRALQDLLEAEGRIVKGVRVTKALHLKTAVTHIGSGTVLVADGLVDHSEIGAASVLLVPPDEARAANCLRVNDALLVPARVPATESALRRFAAKHGLDLVMLEVSEFEKGDGSLTCLSIIV